MNCIGKTHYGDDPEPRPGTHHAGCYFTSDPRPTITRDTPSAGVCRGRRHYLGDPLRGSHAGCSTRPVPRPTSRRALLADRVHRYGVLRELRKPYNGVPGQPVPARWVRLLVSALDPEGMNR